MEALGVAGRWAGSSVWAISLAWLWVDGDATAVDSEVVVVISLSWGSISVMAY